MFFAIVLVLLSTFGLGYVTRLIIVEQRALDQIIKRLNAPPDNNPSTLYNDPQFSSGTVATIDPSIATAMNTVKLTANNDKIAELKASLKKT